MLIIKPVQDKSHQEELAGRCGVGYDPDCLAYGAWVDEKFVGICQFKLGREGRIIDLAKAAGTDDTEAMFIMGRQTMNFIDLHGVHYAYFDGEGDEKFIKWLGFQKTEDGRWGCDLENFFAHPCASEKK